MPAGQTFPAAGIEGTTRITAPCDAAEVTAAPATLPGKL